MERDRFLARIRPSLEAPAETPRAACEPYRPPPVPDRRQMAERLVSELEAAGGIAHRAGSMAEARERVLEILGRAAAKSAIRGDTPLTRRLELDAGLASAGIDVTVGCLSTDTTRQQLRDAAFMAEAGITSVDFGVAETGTLALLAAPGQGRAISLLPPLHVAVLDSRDLVYELAELFEKVTERGGLPSALTLVTGPSRTGDIEQKLTIGIHGPAELHLVLID